MNDDLKNKIKKSIENKEIFILRNSFIDVPSWDNFINLIDFVTSEEYVSSGIRKKAIGYNWDLYTRIADPVDIRTGKNYNNIIPQLDDVIKLFEYIFEEKTPYSECYINFSRHAEKLNPHTDQWTAVSWNCIGQVEWKIYDMNKNAISYILNPGDIIVIPKGVFHSAYPLSPRASISFGYDMNSDIQSDN